MLTASWLNMVERWFPELTTKKIKRVVSVLLALIPPSGRGPKHAERRFRVRRQTDRGRSGRAGPIIMWLGAFLGGGIVRQR